MLRIIIVLTVLLLASLSINYNQFESAKATSILLQVQEQSLKDYDKKIKENSADKQAIQEAYYGVLEKTKVSEVSFDNLSNALQQINCNKGNTIVKAENNAKSAVDPNVVKYYDILHTAYNLQNKH